MKNYATRVFVSILGLLICMLVILFFSYNVFLNLVKQQTFELMTKDIDIVIDDIDQILIDNYNIAYSVQNIEELVDNSNALSAHEYANITNDLVTILAQFDSYINNVIVLPVNSDYIATAGGTFEKEKFFSTYFHNETYTYEFWEGLIEQPFANKYFESAIFYDNAVLSSNESRTLIPYVSKDRYKSDYLIIILIDEKLLQNTIEDELSDTFIALSTQGTIFSSNQNTQYTYEEYEAFLGDSSEITINEPDGSLRYVKKSLDSNIVYSDYISIESLNKLLIATHSTPILIIVFAFLIGIVFAFILSKYISRPINDLKALFEKDINSNSSSDINFIKSQIDSIIIQNNSYSSELADKKNLLMEFVYLSKFKKIYNSNSIIGESTEDDEDNTRLLIYIKINTKQFDDIYALRDTVNDILKKVFTIKFLLIMESDEILVNIEYSENYTIEQLKKSLYELFILELKDICFTLVVGKPYLKEDLSADMYEELAKASKFTYLNSETQIITLNDTNYKKGVYIFFTPAQRKEIYDNIFSANKQEVLNLTTSLLEDNINNNVKNYHLQLACQRVMNLCLNILQDAKNGVSGNIAMDEIYKQLFSLYYYEDYIKLMENFIDLLILSMPNITKDEDDPIISKIKAYVKENYKNDFSLEQLSYDLSISRSYSSTYFKEKTNVNLSTYINNYRVMKSLDLLKNTDMTINEISEEVGIYSVNTFIRLFKKYMGTTPGSYRK